MVTPKLGLTPEAQADRPPPTLGHPGPGPSFPNLNRGFGPATDAVPRAPLPDQVAADPARPPRVGDHGVVGGWLVLVATVVPGPPRPMRRQNDDPVHLGASDSCDETPT